MATSLRPGAADQYGVTAVESRPRSTEAVRERRVVLALLGFVFAMSTWANAALWVEDVETLRFFPPFVAYTDANNNHVLGAEYRHIAIALADGQGFGSPFGGETGPTAWMPPLLPALLAVLFKLTWGIDQVVLIILLAKNLVLVFTGWTIYLAATRTRSRLGPGVAVGLYAVWLLGNFWWFFQHTHDVWLLMLVLDLTLLGAWFWIPDRPSLGRHLAWGLLGGVAFLASPIAGLAWLALAIATGVKTRRMRRTVASITIALVCCGGWVVRNYATFDRFVFMKSNLHYDLVNANFRGGDGVYDQSSFAGHPVWGSDVRDRYKRLGEIAFLDGYRTEFIERVRVEPGTWLRNIGNRLLAITLARRSFNSYDSPFPVMQGFVYAAPFMLLVVLLAVTRFRVDGVMGTAILLYVVYLLPYAGVAFYSRYLLALTPALVLFAFWGLDAAARTQLPTLRVTTSRGTGSFDVRFEWGRSDA